MSDVLVKVEGVSKKFCRSLKRSLWYGVRDIFADLNPFRGNGSDRKVTCTLNTNNPTEFNIPMTDNGRNGEGLRLDEFWAVNNVSFELRRGECLGLIGRNGAGKTTLLKMLNGLIKPDKGRIEMRGRVGALIALGAGFNPILTGRENIYVNGSVLGLTKREIDEKIDEIIDFAEIREFIDSPVQSYSSGMQVRLGFAVAVNVKPDILLIDEVLAVGDVGFRQKAYNAVCEIIENAAVILVSHSITQVAKVCNRGMLLTRGGVNLVSQRLEDVIDGYFAQFHAHSVRVSGPGMAELVSVKCVSRCDASTADLSSGILVNSNQCFRVTHGERVTFTFHFDIDRSVCEYNLGLSFYDMESKAVAQCSSFNTNASFINASPALNINYCSFRDIPLNKGKFSLTLGIYEQKQNGAPQGRILAIYENILEILVSAHGIVHGAAPVQLHAEWGS